MNDEAQQIAAKWVKRLGLGFHPDTRGSDYCDPPLSKAQIKEYDADMDRLFEIYDPYEAGMAAWKAAGLTT